MISKDTALKAKLKITEILNNPNISVGLKFDHRGYSVKIHAKEKLTVPATILNVPIEVEVTGNIII